MVEGILSKPIPFAALSTYHSRDVAVGPRIEVVVASWLSASEGELGAPSGRMEPGGRTRLNDPTVADNECPSRGQACLENPRRLTGMTQVC